MDCFLLYLFVQCSSLTGMFAFTSQSKMAMHLFYKIISKIFKLYFYKMVNKRMGSSVFLHFNVFIQYMKVLKM